MKLSDKIGVQRIVVALAELGLKEVIICPGSRNAPLTISFNRHPAFNCTSIRDERSAAFIALGKAIELKEPVAVVCTSGSAALNFAPAISEAYYQRIPLIVITADRPKEWTDQGDGQTINQTDLYRNFIRKSYELRGDATVGSDLWHNDHCLSEGWNIAAVTDRGPVHFNIPLSEPLYNTSEATDITPKIIVAGRTEKQVSGEIILRLKRELEASEKIMILVGQHTTDKEFQNVLSKIAEWQNVIVLTESTSNVHHPDFVENIDRCITGLNDDDAEELMPDFLITAGGAVVSKRIKALLRKYRPERHWNVDPFDASMDTYQSLTSAVFMDPVDFLRQLLLLHLNVSSGYRNKWIEHKKKIEQLHNGFCESCQYSDFLAFHLLYQYIPEDTVVHFSNSSPIRYAQLFDNSRIAESCCNRGTSGIDGCTSTIVGAAVASPQKKFLLITGDVAFHYDLNALWNNSEPNNLKIVIINNGGGGIFRIISGPGKVDELEEFFETSMSSDAEKLAAHFNWGYLSAKDRESLDVSLKTFFNRKTGRVILEIFTDAGKNPEVLEQYWKFLKENAML